MAQLAHRAPAGERVTRTHVLQIETSTTTTQRGSGTVRGLWARAKHTSSLNTVVGGLLFYNTQMGFLAFSPKILRFTPTTSAHCTHLHSIAFPLATFVFFLFRSSLLFKRAPWLLFLSRRLCRTFDALPIGPHSLRLGSPCYICFPSQPLTPHDAVSGTNIPPGD